MTIWIRFQRDFTFNFNFQFLDHCFHWYSKAEQRFWWRYVILLVIPSPQARFTPSPTSPTPSHGPISFLITQHGAENYQTLETSTISGEN